MLKIFLGWLFFNGGVVHSSKIPSAVLDLNEKFLDVMDNGYWFVKFYAPWCAHCKRLAPTWEHLGHALADMNSEVRVGNVDCTRFPSVASALGITGYPTLIFFRKGARIPYEGERKKKDMLEFAEKSAGPVVQDLTSLIRFYELRKLSDVDPFFVYVVNNNPSTSIPINNEDDDEGDQGNVSQNLYKIYNSIAEELFTEVRFFKTNASVFANIKGIHLREAQQLGTDSIFVIKDRRQIIFDITEPEKLRSWIDAERWPLVPQITTSNIYSVVNSAQKKLVIMSGDATEMIGRQNLSSETGRFYAMFKNAANLSYYDDSLRKIFQYGWTDEISMLRSVIMGDLTLPNVMVLNLSSYEFYLSEDHPDQITEFSLQTFLYRIAADNVTAHGGRSWPTRIRRMIFELTTNIHDMFYYQPILTVCLFGVPLAFFSIIFYSVCSADFSVDRNEIYPEDEEEDFEGDYYHTETQENAEERSQFGENDESANEETIYKDEGEYDEAEEQESADSETELIQSKKGFSHKKSD